jgi:uncharacterized Zn finger protein
VVATPAQLRRRLGRPAEPVQAEPYKRGLARTFWGRAWCKHLEHYSDLANRLPRGRTYLRRGSVVDLAMGTGEISALVQGTKLYSVQIRVDAVDAERAEALRGHCRSELSSAVELLEGRLSDSVMRAVVDPDAGLFPRPKEMRLGCSCPDGALLCKHLAAVLYGVGVRLDDRPELLFELRGLSTEELVAGPAVEQSGPEPDRRLDGDLASVFGIELAEGPAPPEATQAAEGARAGSSSPSPSWSRRKVATRTELLQAGVPASTIQSWLRAGHLQPAKRQGRYRLRAEAKRRLERYATRERA